MRNVVVLQGPVPASMIPDDAVVLFLSHRWLTSNNPDDEVRRARVGCAIAGLARAVVRAKSGKVSGGGGGG